MRIIDNKKDYYDYLSGVYGEDPLAVYDRRGSVSWQAYRDRFSIFYDETRIKQDEYVPPKWTRRRWWWSNSYYLCLEAGRKQFIINILRMVKKENTERVEISMSLFGTREVQRKHAACPLALFECEYDRFLLLNDEAFDPNGVDYWSKGGSYYHHGVTAEPIVENPILKDSFISKLIPAKDIWQALYEYIMSLNNKEIKDTRPDALKIESAGFDLKTSFRNGK